MGKSTNVLKPWQGKKYHIASLPSSTWKPPMKRPALDEMSEADFDPSVGDGNAALWFEKMKNQHFKFEDLNVKKATAFILWNRE